MFRKNLFITERCKENLEAGKVVAAEFSVYGALFSTIEGTVGIIMYKEQKKETPDSWKLPGGPVMQIDFPPDSMEESCTGNIFINALIRETGDKIGISIISNRGEEIVLLPAGTFEGSAVSFVTPLKCQTAEPEEAAILQKRLSAGELEFFPVNNFLTGRNIPEMSPHTLSLIMCAINYACCPCCGELL